MTKPHTASRARFAAFFAREPVEVARDIIGARFLVNGVGGIIVEAEAYAPDDPASHSFGGMRPRNRSMFGPPGIAYVYRSYGVHWCLNFVCREAGHGAAVLIRALEPTDGIPAMKKRRGIANNRLLCAGPGRLTQALGITDALDGLALDAPPFTLTLPKARHETVTGVRIGITKAMEMPWRFGLAGSRFVSRRFKD